MAYSPENGSTPSNPGISYAPGASPTARSQPARSSGTGGGGGGSRNRSDSVKRRQSKNTQTRARDQATGQALVQQDVSFGLVRPYIPWNVFDAASETNPPKTTTSGSFTTLWVAAIEPQHARIRVRFRAVTGAATAGEVRLVDRATGAVLIGGGPYAIGTASTVEDNIDGTLVNPTLSGAGAPMKVDIQGRVTSGANTLGLLIVYAIGIGSA
jgi:hypothetical protein